MSDETTTPTLMTRDNSTPGCDVAALIAERDAWKREALAARERELAALIARMLRPTLTLPPTLS